MKQFDKNDQLSFLAESFSSIDLELDGEKLEQFLKYYEMLVEKNKVMNLTAITEFHDVVRKHFVDSLLITKFVDFENVTRIIDVGTGAGFPGLPIKIAFPEVQVVLMDSLNKRMKFLGEVSDALSLNALEIIHSRAEDLARKPEHREQYDLVVSRAVANLSTLSEYCIPFAKVGGTFLSYKSDQVEEEVEQSAKAMELLGGRLHEVKKLHLDEETVRSFVLIEKRRPTPKKFPRKSGMPSSNPLS